ncbi:hypothetical protein EZS27_037738, partial [termite gut metagenome]
FINNFLLVNNYIINANKTIFYFLLQNKHNLVDIKMVAVKKSIMEKECFYNRTY